MRRKIQRFLKWLREKELTHEEKQFVWIVILGSIVFILVVIAVLLSGFGSFPPVEDTRPVPDYHMNPFGLFTNIFLMAGINK